jgi:hypothetical protein
MREEVGKVLDFGVKIEVERQRAIFGQLVDFGQDVEVWEIHLKHSSQTQNQIRYVKGGKGQAVRVGEVEHN